MNMKDIKEKLINEYPLTKKMDCSFECYEVMKCRYVIFYNEKIDNKNSFDSLPDVFNDATKNFPKGTLLIKGKTLIIVGHTDEEIKKKDLVVCNGNADTFIVYYLKNDSTNEIYFDDQWIYRLGLNWKKRVRKFNENLNS